jgi:hypothetical protein
VRQCGWLSVSRTASFPNSISPVFLPFRLHGGLLFAQNQRAASPTLPVNALSLFNLDSAPIPDAVPLTTSEKNRLAELEQVVEAGLQEFLRTGAALREIRDRRLYRTHFATFADYVRSRFALARSSVDQLIRSQATAQTLLENGETIPPTTAEATIRPLSALPGAQLQSACWALATALAPERGPTQPLVSKVSRLIRNCLEDADQTDETDDTDDNSQEPITHRSGYHLRRSRSPLPRETPFVRPVQRLAAWHGFSAEVVISHIVEPSNAGNLYRACSTMIERCTALQSALADRFPQCAE